MCNRTGETEEEREGGRERERVRERDVWRGEGWWDGPWVNCTVCLTQEIIPRHSLRLTKTPKLWV